MAIFGKEYIYLSKYNDNNKWFDAHFHSFNDYIQYINNPNFIGGIIMDKGELDNQGCYPYNNIYYCLGLDNIDYYNNLDKYIDKICNHLKNKSCVGVKLYPGYLPIYINNPNYYKLYSLIKFYKKVLSIHTGTLANNNGKIKYVRPILIDDISKNFKDLNIVMCHFGNPFLEEASAVIENNYNVYADLSGLIDGNFIFEEYIENNKGYINILKSWIEYCGYNKFIFGTDFPATKSVNDYYKFIKYLLPENEIKNVMINNAKRIYNII